MSETDLTSSKENVYLLVRNPAAVFVCWTWNKSRSEAFGNGVYDQEVLVRLSSSDDKTITAEACVKWNKGRLYMKPPVEGRSYTAAIYVSRIGGGLEKIMESNAVIAPISARGNGLTSGYASAEFFRKENR